MKQCLKCYKTYADDSLNFCLEDGEMLVQGVVAEPPKGSYADDSPPTIVLDQARQTNPTNWPSSQPQQSWQPPAVQFGSGLPQYTMQSASQTLAIVSLGLGIGSLTIGWCCYLGMLLAPAALITGFIALSQQKNHPDRYTGRGFAIGGIATGFTYFGLFILVVIIWGAAVLFGNIN